MAVDECGCGMRHASESARWELALGRTWDRNGPDGANVRQPGAWRLAKIRAHLGARDFRIVYWVAVQGCVVARVGARQGDHAGTAKRAATGALNGWPRSADQRRRSITGSTPWAFMACRSPSVHSGHHQPVLSPISSANSTHTQRSRFGSSLHRVQTVLAQILSLFGIALGGLKRKGAQGA